MGSPGLLDDTGQRRIDPDQVTAIAAERLDTQLAEWAEKYPGVELRTDITRDHPGRVLAAASAHDHLVVLGRHRGVYSGTPAIPGV